VFTFAALVIFLPRGNFRSRPEADDLQRPLFGRLPGVVSEGRVHRDIMEGCNLPCAAVFDHDLFEPRAHRTVNEFDTRRTVKRIDKPRKSIDYRDVWTHRGYGNHFLG